ncbi:MAG: N-6 DNA methylase [Lachnospiraceae bacterium]|nr:N-6 DNA methylase [Lachnospiraceae bacterium]
MDYISVKQAAENFELSERRVQKLCETNRIKGCRMVSGVWLIPANAKKPVDERLTEIPKGSDCLSLKDLCDKLSISTATGRNWMKLGKITPEYTDKKTPYFTKEYANTLKSEIQSGKNKALKNRRNKKYISGNSLYNSYVSEQCKNIVVLQKLLGMTEEESIGFSTNIIQYIVADCALHLFAQKLSLPYKNDNLLLSKFLEGNIVLETYGELIDSLIKDRKEALKFCEKHPLLFSLDYIYEVNEDILGLIYISCKNIGNRKATGSYYTPTKVVKKLISKLDLTANDKILDPCCGTGNFLLQLPATVPFEKIYGNDIDNISVKITRLNMALKYDNLSIKTIMEHITEKNYLTDYTESNFQYIIGNPPWGYEFTEDEKAELRGIYKAATGKNIESYDVFIERALKNLSPNGQLAYVLPEALLNVKAHTDIRKIIMEANSIKYLEYLGNAFDGVQCPCIILLLTHTCQPFSTVGMTVNNSGYITNISIERNVTPEYFSFLTTDGEYQVLEKIKHIESAEFLAHNADFALGIVTGNNKEYLSSEKNNENEMILKGSDICKYHINPTDNYIIFRPERFQQVAPTKMYRAPEKLLYRFISSQLVFAYDNRQTLSLNSCNIVIPKLKRAKIKYILAILNSRVAQFIYKMDFHSIKVLRSHIESIPIPIVDEAIQNNIIQITDTLIAGMTLDDAQATYEQLDQLIFEVFDLTPDEQNIIKSAIDGENKFLV